VSNAARSALSRRLIKAVCRQLSSTKERARPITCSELSRLCARISGVVDRTRALLARCISLIAFWACLRLGTLLQEPNSLKAVVTWNDFILDGPDLILTIHSDKTVHGFDFTHRVRIRALPAGCSLCPVAAFLALRDHVAYLWPTMRTDSPFSLVDGIS